MEEVLSQRKMDRHSMVFLTKETLSMVKSTRLMKISMREVTKMICIMEREL
jgi:hypothetical protein